MGFKNDGNNPIQNVSLLLLPLNPMFQVRNFRECGSKLLNSQETVAVSVAQTAGNAKICVLAKDEQK